MSARARLETLLAPTGDFVQDFLPDNVQSFESALDNLVEWKDRTTSYIFLRDDPCVREKKDLIAQRVQLNGLCYLHAPVLLHHYLASRNLPGNQTAGLLNLARYIRECFDPESLQRQIFSDKGGYSLEVLEQILEPNSELAFLELGKVNRRTLEEFGPGLIYQMAIHSDFSSRKHRWKHTGRAIGQRFGYHSKLCIGVREETEKLSWWKRAWKKPRKTRYFLLQNFWQTKQFVEVDEEYIESCRARVAFVKTPQIKILWGLPITSGKYAESANLDKPEQLPEERLESYSRIFSVIVEDFAAYLSRLTCYDAVVESKGLNVCMIYILEIYLVRPKCCLHKTIGAFPAQFKVASTNKPTAILNENFFHLYDVI